MTHDDTRDNLRFAESVSGGSEVTLTHEVQREATIESVDVRIYRGAELDLQVEPFIEPSGRSGQEFPLLTFIGKSFVDGDGDFFEFDLVERVGPGDQIGVRARNLEPDYDYDFSVDVDLDHAGGTDRSATGLLGRWF